MLAVNKSISYAVSYVPKNTSLYGVPAGAVIGGFTADHFPLYIVELGVMGHLDAHNNYAECLYHRNIPTIATTWNSLVLEYSKLHSYTRNIDQFNAHVPPPSHHTHRLYTQFNTLTIIRWYCSSPDNNYLWLLGVWIASDPRSHCYSWLKLV